ncbi:MAG: glycosyltransferase [Nitrospiraceae bacterium]
MKIVFCGPACNQPNGEGSYAYHNMRAPLLEMGHDIIDVDFRAELAQRGKDGFARMVRDIVDREKPELFFHMVCEDELSPETVQYISAKTSTLAVAFFSDDDWRLTHSLSVVAPYNFGVTTASQAVPVYTKAGFTNVIFSQYAANPKLFHPIVGVAKQYDVTFVGQAYQGRPELVTWLKEQGLSIHVWGQGWERVPALRECSGGFLPQNEVLNVFAASRIVLGMSWTSDAKALQIKGRIFEYASAGVFQLSTYDARLADYFAWGREIELYRDQTELLEKIRYYLVHDEERERIAQAGRARVLKDHTWTHRFEQLFEGMNRRLPPGKQVLRSTDGAPVSQPLPADAEHEPKVSIICTVLNGERYLDETIRSVLNLDYADWELILFDDGSTDGTRNIAMRHSHDPRIRYIYHTNIAQSGRYFDLLLNTCMEYVRGEYVAFIGADDNFMPEKLSVQLAAIEADPTIDLVFSDGMHIDASGRRLPSDFGFAESKCFTSRSLLRTLFKKNIVAHPTVLLRRDAIERLGGFETGFCPDYQFWLKAARFLRFAYIDKKLVQYRVHDQGVSTGKASKTLPETVKLLGMMRERVTIHDLYPELDACSDKSAALYSAYLHFGLLLAMANIPVPQQAILEWQRALEHRPDGIEAVNNIAVVLALMGSPEKAERWLKTRNVRFDQAPPAQENRSLLKQLVQGAKTLPKAFMFMSEDPEEVWVLLRRLVGGAQLEINRHYYGRLVAGIQSVKRASASTPAEPVRQAPVTQGPSKAESRRPASMPPLKPVQASTPLVSVIIPTVNRPQQLMEAVKSVLAQTLQDFEIIVVNDAGSEVEPLLAACSGSRAITYIRHGTNLERSATRNHGLKVARGKYIAYLDDDDRFLPHHLETLVGFLETHDYRVAYSDAWRVTQVKEGEQYREVGRDVPYSSDFNAQQLLITNYFPILSVVHERACLDEVGYFDESLSSHEDWDLWIRLSRRFAFAHIKQTTCEFTWRTDGSSTTSRNRKDFLRTAEIIYRKYRDISKAIPGVCELQAQSLQALREATEGKDRTYVCSIIIPVWNKVELTQQCVTALAEVTDEVDYEVIIVDNGSTDGTPAFLGQLSGDVHIIRNEENLGFSKACNQGAKAARGSSWCS